MKRFLIVIFALLYIGLSSGITLTIHHCMGKLVEVGIWQDETCNTCGAKHAHKSCCSTETQFIKMQTIRMSTSYRLLNMYRWQSHFCSIYGIFITYRKQNRKPISLFIPTPHLNGVGQTGSFIIVLSLFS